jgi:hypothetical protein
MSDALVAVRLSNTQDFEFLAGTTSQEATNELRVIFPSLGGVFIKETLSQRMLLSTDMLSSGYLYEYVVISPRERKELEFIVSFSKS